MALVHHVQIIKLHLKTKSLVNKNSVLKNEKKLTKMVHVNFVIHIRGQMLGEETAFSLFVNLDKKLARMVNVLNVRNMKL